MLMGWPGSGQAQVPTPPSAFKDWRYECLAPKAAATGVATSPNDAKAVCTIQHDVRTSEGLQLVVRVRILESTREAHLIFVLPPTLSVDAPVGYSIDQGDEATTHVRQCNPQFCWANVPIGDDLADCLPGPVGTPPGSTNPPAGNNSNSGGNNGGGGGDGGGSDNGGFGAGRDNSSGHQGGGFGNK
jgi:hypothetical protein